MSLTEHEILTGIAEVARKHVGWNQPIRMEMRLMEDLDLDSLKALTLALEVENHFRVLLDEESGIETVGDLVAAIGSQLGD